MDSLKQLRQRCEYGISRAENIAEEANASAEHLRILRDGLTEHIEAAEPPPVVEPPVEPDPPVVIGPGAEPLIVEGWSDYATIEEYRAANVSPHEGRYRTAGKNPDRWSFGPPMPGSDARHSLVYTFPDRTGLRSDYSIQRDLYLPTPVTELWAEAWVKFDADYWCQEAPEDWPGTTKSSGLKLLFFNVSPDGSGRFQVKAGVFGNRWRANGPHDPPGDFQFDQYEAKVDWPSMRGRWVPVRMWAKYHGDGTASMRATVEGHVVYERARFPALGESMWGLRIGANQHPGPPQEQSYVWGLVRAWKEDPGW